MLNAQMTLAPITDSERADFSEFARAHPRMSDILPARISNGFVFNAFSPVCRCCSHAIPAFSSWVARSPIALGAKLVEAWEIRGMCPDCHRITTVCLRFRNNGTYDQLVNGSWETDVLEPAGTKLSAFDHLATWRNCFHALRLAVGLGRGQ